MGHSLRDGAAQSAPTAPHATPASPDAPRTGPGKFWQASRARTALRVFLGVSIGAHLALSIKVAGWAMPEGFEIKDLEGEAAIPVDIFEDTTNTTPPEQVPPQATNPNSDQSGSGANATAHLDGGLPDGNRLPDASQPEDASADAPVDADTLDGAIAMVDSGSRDPAQVLGPIGGVQADTVYVMVVVNAAVIRTNETGKQMGVLLTAIPQWDEFMKGTNVDPIGQTDWIVITGPSLRNSTRDVVTIHYSAPDAVIDRAVDVITKRYAEEQHAATNMYDAGSGVVAKLGHADKGERVFLRPSPGVLIVSPTSAAARVAAAVRRAPVPAHLRGDLDKKAAFIQVKQPHNAMPDIPESITELRMTIATNEDQSADVDIDNDCPDANAARAAADEIKRLLQRKIGSIPNFLTGGFAQNPDITVNGTRVHVHVRATAEQLEKLFNLVAAAMNVDLNHPRGASPAPAPAPRPTTSSSTSSAQPRP